MLHWVVQPNTLGVSADLEYALTLLEAARRGRLSGGVVRLYRPEPTVAFGQRDRHLPGFATACEASLDHGFTPVVRRAGGRAAAYHHGCLVVDHVQPDPDAITATQSRFADFARLFAHAFHRVQVPAAVGEVPGEYCPGEYSVHTPLPVTGSRPRTPVKLVGTAQRVVKGAWLFSSSVVVEDPEPIRAVLVEVYAALGLSWEPATAGAATDAAPHVDVEAVRTALLAQYGQRAAAESGQQDGGQDGGDPTPAPAVRPMPWDALLSRVPSGPG